MIQSIQARIDAQFLHRPPPVGRSITPILTQLKAESDERFLRGLVDLPHVGIISTTWGRRFTYTASFIQLHFWKLNNKWVFKVLVAYIPSTLENNYSASRYLNEERNYLVVNRAGLFNVESGLVTFSVKNDTFNKRRYFYLTPKQIHDIVVALNDYENGLKDHYYWAPVLEQWTKELREVRDDTPEALTIANKIYNDIHRFSSFKRDLYMPLYDKAQQIRRYHAGQHNVVSFPFGLASTAPLYSDGTWTTTVATTGYNRNPNDGVQQNSGILQPSEQMESRQETGVPGESPLPIPPDGTQEHPYTMSSLGQYYSPTREAARAMEAYQRFMQHVEDERIRREQQHTDPVITPPIRPQGFFDDVVDRWLERRYETGERDDE